MHATVPEAIAASSTTFVVINSEPKLQTVKDLLSQDSDESTPSFMEGKTIVNMVNHDPFAAEELDAMIRKQGGNHVAALMFGVPETVCSPASHLLVSTSGHGSSAPSVLELGQVHEFTRTDDVGLASVVYLCLVQSLYFGLAGYELSLLILQKYMARKLEEGGGNDTSSRILQKYQKLTTTLLSTYIPAFLPIISNTINNQQWTQSYVPAAAVVDMFALHDEVFDKLNLFQDNYHDTYVKYLQRTIAAAKANGEDGEAIGVSAVVRQYSVDDFSLPTRQSTTTSNNNQDDNEL